MDNFEQLLGRVSMMRQYGMKDSDIRVQLLSEGVGEEIIFFACKGVDVLENNCPENN